MKFVCIEEGVLKSIEITDPTPLPGLEYYWPDGVTKGFGRKKKIYYLSERDFLGNIHYYESPSSYSDQNGPGLYSDSGKVMRSGCVKWDFGSDMEKQVFWYKTKEELLKYFEPVRSFLDPTKYICFTGPVPVSLYTYLNDRAGY